MSPSVELLRRRDRLSCRTLYAFPLVIFQKLASQFAFHIAGKFSALASHFLYCILFLSLFPLPLFLIFGCFLFYFTPCFCQRFFLFPRRTEVVAGDRLHRRILFLVTLLLPCSGSPSFCGNIAISQGHHHHIRRPFAHLSRKF
jgi:hypothetical protein